MFVPESVVLKLSAGLIKNQLQTESLGDPVLLDLHFLLFFLLLKFIEKFYIYKLPYNLSVK